MASPTPPAVQIPIESLFGLIRDAHTVDRSGVAAAAALVFDIIITMDQEVEYIWKSEWTLPKFLYFFSRYFALIVQIVNMHESTDFNVTDNVSDSSYDHCHSWTMFEGIAGQLIVMGVEISLMLRVYALYKRDKRILTLLVFLYIAEVTANSVILGLALESIVSIAPLRSIFPPGFPLSGCFPTFVPGYFYSYWIPTLIFESVLFILMTINFVRLARAQRTPMPLLTLFYRDGTAFYAVIFVTLLTQVLLYELVNSALAQVAIAWELTIFSVAGSRLILNLRASGTSRLPYPVESLEMGSMRFDRNPASPSVQLDSCLSDDLEGRRRGGASAVGSGTTSSGYGTGSETRHGSQYAYNGKDGGADKHVISLDRAKVERRDEESTWTDEDTREDWISEWERV